MRIIILLFLQTLIFSSLTALSKQQEAWIDSLLNFKVDYSSLVEEVKKELTSEEEITDFFTLLYKAVDPYRYKTIEDQKNKIVKIIEPLDSNMAEDISLLIDTVVTLLQDLRIHYHDIQHTLEVVLGTTQAVIEGYKEGKFIDYKMASLPIVAALFHDIGYSNAAQTKYFMLQLPKEKYSSLFFAINGEKFVEAFEQTMQEIAFTPSVGAEMHLYHVHFSQVLLPYILNMLPEPFHYKEFFLSKESLESICSMISLTDIKTISIPYREAQRAILAQKNLLFAGECLATCDLYMQLSTIDRLSKGLGLYHEFVIGKDKLFWKRGASLIASATEFYENFAKERLHPEVLSSLDRHFKEDPNPHQIGLAYTFFLHKLFGTIYPKLHSTDLITEQDLFFLKELKKHGLQAEVVDLFIAATHTKAAKEPPIDLLNSLRSIAENKGSFLEITIGEEIRLLLKK